VIPRLSARAVALVLFGALLAGCANDGAATESSEPTSDLAAVTVSGDAGKKPTVKVPQPFAVDKTDRKVLTEGKGPELAEGQRVTVNYVGVNGTDGKEFDTSFESGKRPSFTLDPAQNIKGLVNGLTGTKVGSRVLIAIPPEDAYGTQGQPALGIGPTDTLLFVIDVASARTVLERASGTAVAPKAGLPTVKLEKSGAPKITVPKGTPPAKLVVQPLIQGKGPAVGKGQTGLFHYTGIIWQSGKQFDSSWDRGAPADFAVGVGQVIAGWDEALLGKRVGSQLLLVIPPDKGYGIGGNPEAGIKGTDTLVFVVDVLDVEA
jgi:peptidylprolyl isomerase